MKILLDTCAFLWIITDDPNLSPRARELFLDTDNVVFLSSVSTWEIAIKNALGRLKLPEPPETFIPEQREKHGIVSMLLDEETTLHLRRLPPVHNDPFDRMLICQSMVHGMLLLSPDKYFSQYPVRSTW